MKRTFDVSELEMRSDGRTVEGRIIPYNEVSRIVQRDKETGQLVQFDEQFLPGSCAAMAQACQRRGNASFVSYLIDHNEQDFDARIGYATTITDEKDGGYASFRLYESKDIDKVRSMLRESHKGLSVNFAAVKPPRLINDVVSHVQVHIEHVAATATPAYEGARIMAMRSETLEVVEFETPNLDAVTAWLEEMRSANA